LSDRTETGAEWHRILAATERYLRRQQEEGWDWLPARPPGGIELEPEPAPERAPAFLTLEERAQALDSLRAEVRRCRRCPLHERRRQAVFGEGSLTTGFIFVGEAPGAEEDLQGRPFVGDAGKLLTKIVEALGFAREEVYITNVIKCRPPNNRDPEPEEIRACREYMDRQLELLHPKVVCSLGRHSSQALLDSALPISRLRGRIHEVRGLRVVPTYHPAALLRNPGWKRDAWADVQLARDVLRGVC
jgi:DNA polymerase